MKKTGFTLAEVLITLSIIGIVAMMTLPALMTNVQEQQAKTGLKKGLNTVIEAAQMNLAIQGFDYGTLGTTGTGEDDASLTGLLLQRTQYDPSKSYFGTAPANDSAYKAVEGASGTNYVVFFRDGSSLEYNNTATTAAGVRDYQVDGLPKGFTVIYDINGEKAPNVYSNCKGNTAARAGVATSDETDISKCTKAKRVIKDQFSIQLRGTFAQPWGAAARWAFEH